MRKYLTIEHGAELSRGEIETMIHFFTKRNCKIKVEYSEEGLDIVFQRVKIHQEFEPLDDCK